MAEWDTRREDHIRRFRLTRRASSLQASRHGLLQFWNTNTTGRNNWKDGQSRTLMSDPSTFTWYVLTQADGLLTETPVFTLNCQECHGHVTTSPSNSPSPSGPPRWTHVLSTA